MARVKGPLLSLGAMGKFGGALLFRDGPAGPRVSRLPDPTRVNKQQASTSQAAVRSRYAQAAEAWRALTDNQREQWNARARAHPTASHGWALYLQAEWSGAPIEPTNPAWDDGTTTWDDGSTWS